MNKSGKNKNSEMLDKLRSDLKRTNLQPDSGDRRRFQKLRKAIKDIRKRNSNK